MQTELIILTTFLSGGFYAVCPEPDDVVRMLALGAKSVLLGRSWVYALAARGQKGVEHVIDLIHKEMIVAMTLTGCRSLKDINRKVIDNSLIK